MSGSHSLSSSDSVPKDFNLANIKVHINSTGFADFLGYDNLKNSLRGMIVVPLVHPGAFNPLQNILLHGPKGTGKTFLVNSLAAQCGADLYLIDAGNLQVFEEQTEIKITRIFMGLRASPKPAILCIKNIDILCKAERVIDVVHRFKYQLCEELRQDGYVRNHFLVVATTHAPWNIESNLMGSFKMTKFVPFPDEMDRRIMFTQRAALHNRNIDHILHELVKRTSGLTYYYIVTLMCRAELIPHAELLLSSHWFEMGGLFAPYQDWMNPVSTAVHYVSMSQLPRDRLFFRDLQLKDFTMCLSNSIKLSTNEQLEFVMFMVNR